MKWRDKLVKVFITFKEWIRYFVKLLNTYGLFISTHELYVSDLRYMSYEHMKKVGIWTPDTLLLHI